jgi:WD40 repeat protein/DNA-binding SARP family transcriptional activator
MLQIRLLGQFDVRAAGKRIDIPARAGQSLLAYLLLNAGTPQRRERLAGLLWPDTSDEHARHNLRTELWRIRKALGSRDDADHDYLLTEDLTITFNPEAQFWLDVNQLQRPTSSDGTLDDLLGQLTLYQGELLPGFYDDWIVLERERLQALFERDMKRLLERLCEEQRWTTVLEWSERWIALGQTPEPAYRALMAAYAALGDRTKAIATFERCRAALEHELGVEPSPETQNLYDRLARGETITSVDLSATQIAPVQAHLIEQPPAPGEPPFKGLQYFDEADADLFFGREALTAKLIERLYQSNFLAVIVGASGSGKSSIVRAGLIPALKRAQPQWLVHIITPTAHPLEALAIALTHDTESITAAATLLDDLSHEPRSLALSSKRMLKMHGAPRLLLVIDQFEEVFTLCRDEFEREAFIDNLLAALAPSPAKAGDPLKGAGGWSGGPVTLILTLRADFYAHLAQYPELRDAVAKQQEYIGPMTTDELRRAIEEPAKRGGWEFEPGLVDLMLRDVGDEPGALPLLSHALLETWQRRSGHTMTLKGYADAGGVRGAIAYTAENAYQQLTPEQQDLARHIFLELTELGEGTEDTRRRVKIDELIAQSDQVRPLLTTLADARLITTGEDTVEVAHEALIREWPRLRDWLNEDREGLRLHRQLSEAAHDWELLEHDPGALYRGARLSQANEWAAGNEKALSTSQCAFLAASNELEQREAAEREAQRQRELQAALTLAKTQQHAATRLRRRNRVIIGAGVVALLLAGLAGLFGAQANQNATLADQNAAQAQAEAQTRATQQAMAEANFTRAEAQRLAAEASNLLLTNGNAEQMALLSLRSLNLEYSPQGDVALAGASRLNYPKQILTGHTGWVDDVAFSPDGRYILTGSRDGTVRLWDVQTGQQLRQMDVTPGAAVSVAFSPGGQLALTGDGGRNATAWDVQTGQRLRNFDLDDVVLDVAFASDGKSIVVVTAAQKVYLLNAQTGDVIHEIIGRDWMWSATLSPDNRYLVTADFSGPARLWDIQTGQEVRGFSGDTSGIDCVDFSPDGKYIAVGTTGTIVWLWEVSTGRKVQAFSGHTSAVQDVAFSPDGRYVASASADRTARLWDTQSGKSIRTFSGHTEGLNSVEFSPDGKYLVTGSADGTARLWETNPQLEPPEFSGHTAFVNGAAFSPDGRFLLTTSDDGTARWWDTRTGQPVRQFVGHQGVIWAAAISADGQSALTSGFDGTIRLWQVKTGQEVQQFVPSTNYGAPLAVAFSPDNHYVLAGYGGGIIIVWNLDTGQLLRLDGTHTDGIAAVEVSADGKYALSSSRDGVAILWSFPDLVEVRRFMGHMDVLQGAVFSPDGRYILTGSMDKTTRLWDTQSGTELRQFVGHTTGIYSVAYSPDGKTVATGSGDGTARIWDAQTGQELRRFDTRAYVFVMKFSPDGKYLLTGDSTGSVRLWPVNYHDTMAYLCSRLLRDFTDDERKKFGITDTTPTCPQQ